MRRGFTLVEALVGFSVMVLVSAMIHGFYVSAASGTARSVEASDALRSVLIASEFLRSDLGEMAFIDPKDDIRIHPAKKTFSFRVPPVLSKDLWKGDYEVLTYQLERLPGNEKVHRLIRKLADKPEPIGSCLLKDMIVRIVPARGAVVPWDPAYAPSGISAYQAYLEITLVGVGSMAAKHSYTSTVLHPLTLMVPPQPYQLLTGGP